MSVKEALPPFLHKQTLPTYMTSLLRPKRASVGPSETWRPKGVVLHGPTSSATHRGASGDAPGFPAMTEHETSWSSLKSEVQPSRPSRPESSSSSSSGNGSGEELMHADPLIVTQDMRAGLPRSVRSGDHTLRLWRKHRNLRSFAAGKPIRTAACPAMGRPTRAFCKKGASRHDTDAGRLVP